jgi:GNAT superfamily N-acetyltransferase
MMRTEPTIRLATLVDHPVLAQLIARSTRGLSTRDYSAEQIEAALEGVFGVDSQLILDATYYVAEFGDWIAGCGGWSRRSRLFGGDAQPQGEVRLLDPAVDAARIRAFFVDPLAARRGIARAILALCEAAASREGFKRVELMATLPGVPFYLAHGYIAGDRETHPLNQELNIEFIPMHKHLRST